MKTLIRNATVVTAESAEIGSVLIDGPSIAGVDFGRGVGAVAGGTADEVVDGSGWVLLPGVIDDQVHFREPGLTHKEDLAHATRACARGGVTTFLEMPNTWPPTIDQARVDEKRALAAASSLVDFGFYIGATESNLAALQTAERTPGIKIFIGSSTGDLLVDRQEVLERIFAETRLPICAHCEDETTIRANAARLGPTDRVADHSRIRDRRAAAIATARAADLARRHRHPFHVLHLSTADEIPLVAEHGGVITAEVCPHHLLFHEGDYARLGARIKVNPAIKSAADNQALWEALRDGRIQVLATDHAPHTLAEKRQPYPACPSGLPAVENSLALMLNELHAGRLTLPQIAERMSAAPARVWNILRKGKIAPGFDADLVLVDLQRSRTIRDEEQQSKCRWSPWHGTEVRGIPLRTWVRGKTVYRWAPEGEWFASPPHGRPAEFDPGLGGYWRHTL